MPLHKQKSCQTFLKKKKTGIKFPVLNLLNLFEFLF